MKWWVAALASAALLTSAAQAAAARDAVRVLALRDALDPVVLDGASRTLKADILVDGFASTGEVEAALRATGAAYDLVLLPADAIGSRIRPDLLAPLDPSAVPEAAGVQPQLTAAIGSAARVAVPFDWYPTGFAVNAAKLKDAGLPDEPTVGWDVLGRPDLLRRALACGFGWPAGAQEVYAVVTSALEGGVPDAGHRRALTLMSQVRTEARKGSAAELADGVASGDLCAAVLPAPDALLAGERAQLAGNGVGLGFLLPAGGGLLTIDVLAVPSAAHNRAGGLALLRALLRPETTAANARATHVAPSVGSSGAEAPFDPALLPRLRQVPPPDAGLARAVTAAWERGPGH